MVNTAGSRYLTAEFGGLDVPPGATVDIEDGYCQPGINVNGSRRPSIVERLAPCLKPADPEQRARWGLDTVPAPAPAPTADQVAAQLRDEGVAPAVAELIASGQAEAPKTSRRGRPRRDEVG